jgi:hypothetical protein
MDFRGVVSGVMIICIMFLCGGAIGMNYWDAQQVRVMYQTAYAKNMECRVSITQSRGSDFVNKVCGEIPKFEDYND